MFGTYFAILALQLARGQEAAASANEQFRKMVETADDEADKNWLDGVKEKAMNTFKEKAEEVHNKVKDVVDEHLNNTEGDKTSSGSKDEAGANQEEKCSAEGKSMEIWSTIKNGFKGVFTFEAVKDAHKCVVECGSEAKACFYNVPSLIWQTICFVLFLCLFLCCGGCSCLGKLLCCLFCCRCRSKDKARE